MNIWMVNCNSGYFNVNRAFGSYTTVTWPQPYGVAEGDVVYIYVPSSSKSVMYKCAVLASDLRQMDPVTVPFVYSPFFYDGADTYMRLELLAKYPEGKITEETLRANGVEIPVSGGMIDGRSARVIEVLSGVNPGGDYTAGVAAAAAGTAGTAGSSTSTSSAASGTVSGTVSASPADDMRESHTASYVSSGGAAPGPAPARKSKRWIIWAIVALLIFGPVIGSNLSHDSSSGSSSSGDEDFAYEEEEEEEPDPFEGLVEQEMPENEYKFVNTFDSRPSQIIVENNSDNGYYIKFEDENGKTVFAFFSRPKSTTPMYMGVGTFYLKYAYGSTWYGEEHLFGPYTSYYKDPEPWEFTSDMYWTLTLQTADGEGNMNTESIDGEDF